MTLTLAVVGPGRVGSALALLWGEGGCELLGFLGTSEASIRAALAFCRAGRSLQAADLTSADVIAFTTPDDRLAAAVKSLAAAGGPRGGSLCVHTSGVHDLDVLAPLASSGARLGSLHPLCPVPDPDRGVRDLPGKPAVVVGADERTAEDLEDLARRAGLRPVCLAARADRAVYHAACALAANGLTALADLATSLFEHCGAGDASSSLATELMRAALDNVARRDAASALTGPVQRGDRDVVARHLAGLQEHAPSALDTYRALMARAAELAHRAGHLTDAQVAAFARQLRGDR